MFTSGFADILRGSFGPDLLDAGPGDDLVEGRSGADEVRGGVGRDEINAGAGDDLVVSRERWDVAGSPHEGPPEFVTCGTGADLAIADHTDVLHRDCERIGSERGGLDFGPYRVHPVRRTWSALVFEATCGGRRVGAATCRTEIRLWHRRTTLIGYGSRTLRNGDRARIAVRLTAAGRRLARRVDSAELLVAARKRVRRSYLVRGRPFHSRQRTMWSIETPF